MIKMIAQVTKSKVDFYGNSYYFATITDVEKGKSATGILSGNESNISLALKTSGLEWGEFVVNLSELPIRQFNKMAKGLPYMGCESNQIIEFCNRQWGN